MAIPERTQKLLTDMRCPSRDEAKSMLQLIDFIEQTQAEGETKAEAWATLRGICAGVILFPR